MSIEDSATATQDSYRSAVKDEGSLVRLWLDAIAISTKEEEDWRKQAQNAVDLYRQSKGKDVGDNKKKFNILHSNIETICPALYNSTPAPDVRRRFNDPDPIAKAVADIQERCLSYSVDAYDFDHVMQMTVKDMELPGRAVVRVRYKPYLDRDENIAYQEVICEHVPWKHFRRGPGNEWGDVPWIAFENFLTREELLKLSPELGSKVNLDVSVNHNDKDEDRNVPEVFKRARVWEIWDKERQKIIFIAESMKDKPLREDDDPLELEGFFPIPRPLYGVQTADSLVPVVPYDIYRAQAEELERVSQRIAVLTEAVKAKAIYDARLTEMERLERSEDADHIPLENVQIFADGSKLSDHIMWYPIEVIVAALEKLYEAREQIKATIYEITGISDILRGQSMASETATAQNIKQQWGSLRIQSKQADIQRFARDLFRLKAELFASKFEPQVLQMMTGIQIQPEVMQLLRSDKLRSFRVDIESDSTIRADLTRNQQNMSMFLQGTAQFAQAMGPIVATDKNMMPAVMEVYAAFARNFRLGKQAEDALEAVNVKAQQMANQPPPPPPPDPKVMAEQAKAQAMMQQTQMDMQAAQEKHQMDMAKMAAEMQTKQAELEIEREKLVLKEREIQIDIAATERKAAIDSANSQMEAIRSEQDHKMEMHASAAKHAMNMDAMKKKASQSKHK